MILLNIAVGFLLSGFWNFLMLLFQTIQCDARVNQRPQIDRLYHFASRRFIMLHIVPFLAIQRCHHRRDMGITNQTREITHDTSTTTTVLACSKPPVHVIGLVGCFANHGVSSLREVIVQIATRRGKVCSSTCYVFGKRIWSNDQPESTISVINLTIHFPSSNHFPMMWTTSPAPTWRNGRGGGSTRRVRVDRQGESLLTSATKVGDGSGFGWAREVIDPG